MQFVGCFHFQGPLKGIKDKQLKIPCNTWLSSFPSSPVPFKSSGIQSALLQILSSSEKCRDLPYAIAQKLCTTLEEEVASNISLPVSWFSDLTDKLDRCKVLVRVCWLKAMAGAWCTSVRLHTTIIWPCIFGCKDARDELGHYLACPVLWQFAREFVGAEEPSIAIGSRLCIVQPSIAKLHALACVHSLYHACRNDPGCTDCEGYILPAATVQFRAIGLARSVRHYVSFDS